MNWTNDCADTQRQLRRPPPPFALLLLCAAACGILGSGCKLLTIKMPGEPMTKTDLALRTQTREFAQVYAAAVQQVADQVLEQATDPSLKTRSVLWKIGCVSNVRKATLRTTPSLALVDTWGFCRQMNEFLSQGAGRDLFGGHQSLLLTNCQSLERRIGNIARTLLPTSEAHRMDQFLAGYVQEFPLKSLSLEREPVTARWEDARGAATVAPPAGTTSEALTDFADRLQAIGQQVPEELRWRWSLEAENLHQGMARTGVTLDRLDTALARIAQVAADSPTTLSNAVTELRVGLLPVFDRFEKQWGVTLETFQKERQSLSENFATERAAVLKAVDEQRAALIKAADEQRSALVKDAQTLSREMIDQSLGYVHRTLRNVLIFLVVLAVVVLGLPFGFGFLVGRAMGRRGVEQAPMSRPESGPSSAG